MEGAWETLGMCFVQDTMLSSLLQVMHISNLFLHLSTGQTEDFFCL
jgi:hypothetical protein